MKTVEKKINTGKVEDGSYKETTIQATQVESWTEAITYAGDETKALARFNSQIMTDQMNDARETLRGKVNRVEAAKAEMAEESIKRLMGAPVNLAFPMAFQAIMGKPPVETDYAKYGVTAPTA